MGAKILHARNEACKPIDSPDSPDSPDESPTRRHLILLNFFIIPPIPPIPPIPTGKNNLACVSIIARVSSQVPSRFWGSKTLRRVSVRLASRRPKKGLFWALSDGASMDGLARMGGRFVPPAQG